MSPSAHQCETVVVADRHQSARAAKRATQFEAKGTTRAQDLECELQSAAHGQAHNVAGGQQTPGISRPLPAGSSRLCKAHGRQRVAMAAPWYCDTHHQSSARGMMWEAGQARHPHLPAGASSKVPPCTTASQQGSGPDITGGLEAKQGHSSPRGYVWSPGSEEGWAHRPFGVLGFPPQAV